MLFTSPKLKKAIVCGPSLEKVHTSHMCLSHIYYWTWEGEGLGMYLCLGYAWVCHQALALVLWSSSNVCFVHLLLSTSFVVTTPEQQQVKAQYSHLQQGPWMADSGISALGQAACPCGPVGEGSESQDPSHHPSWNPVVGQGASPRVLCGTPGGAMG